MFNLWFNIHSGLNWDPFKCKLVWLRGDRWYTLKFYEGLVYEAKASIDVLALQIYSRPTSVTRSSRSKIYWNGSWLPTVAKYGRRPHISLRSMQLRSTRLIWTTIQYVQVITPSASRFPNKLNTALPPHSLTNRFNSHRLVKRIE
jgi:hypothetical protein